MTVFIFNRKFMTSILPLFVQRLATTIPYAVLFAFPVDGSTSRENTRIHIWVVAAVIELFGPFLWVPAQLILLRKVGNAHRTALINPAFLLESDIEHMAERTGALYVFALGVVAVSFLFTMKNSGADSVVGVMILALLIGYNLNHIYFRSEAGSHYKHALRRAWYTGILWTFFHYPLVIATLSLGAIMSPMINIRFSAAEQIVPVETLHSDYKNIYFGSLGVCYLCFAALKILHQEHPDQTPDKTKQPDNKLSDNSRGDSGGGGTEIAESKQLIKKKKHKRNKVPNLSHNTRIALVAALTCLIFAVGFGVSEKYWSVDSMFGFGAAVTSFSVFMMECMDDYFFFS
ncbi:hypothetical protein HK100_003296 [Physocladia obscura]|uniref:Transmembrane protein n=1 Tax=Physocladia obscura TaxID=109957 RepID=A0AAD5XAJ3_9FUNG|nr:hypothetical protein HK100_003296 [Physocladia obscura]